MRSVARISAVPSPPSRRGACLSATGRKQWRLGVKACLPRAYAYARLKVWNGLSFLFGGRRAVWYSITDRRVTHPEEFKADMAALFDLLREGAIHPVVVDRLPIAAALRGP